MESDTRKGRKRESSMGKKQDSEGMLLTELNTRMAFIEGDKEGKAMKSIDKVK
ncbi:unnamed protein product, partial [Dovyalis caffra]